MTISRWGRGLHPFAEYGTPTTCIVTALAGQPIHAKNMADRQALSNTVPHPIASLV